MQLCALHRSSRYQQQSAVRHFSRSVLVLEGTTKDPHTYGTLDKVGIYSDFVLGQGEGEDGQNNSDSIGKYISPK
jgi:hypothetical protein